MKEKRLFVALAVTAFFCILFTVSGWSASTGVIVFCAICYGLTVIGTSLYCYCRKKVTDGIIDAVALAGGTGFVLGLTGFALVWALDKYTDCYPEFAQIMRYPTLGLACAVPIVVGCIVLYFPISDWKNNRILTKHDRWMFTWQLCLAVCLIFLGIGLEGLWVFSFAAKAFLRIAAITFIAAIVVLVIDFFARYDEI